MANILCIIDGMTDRSFEIEDYENLSSFSQVHYIDTRPPGFEPETLPCILNILGVKDVPRNIRGWIEALGLGIDIDEDDLIFRGSWIEVDDKGICQAFGKIPKDIMSLSGLTHYAIDKDKSIFISKNMARYIDSLETTMPYDILNKNKKEIVYPEIPGIKEELVKLNRGLSNLVMLAWAYSVKSKMPDYSNYVAICGTNVVKGIAKALNMKLITTFDMTGDIDTNLKAKLDYTLAAANFNDHIMLHIGGCDEASHRKNAFEKRVFLEKIDRIIIAGLLQSKHYIKVISDHGSDPLTGKHTRDLQPVFLYAY